MGENIDVLVCREALDRGLISRGQLDECLKTADTPTTSVLVSRGLLTSDQVAHLRTEITRRLASEAPTLPTPPSKPVARKDADETPPEVRAAIKAGAKRIGKYQVVRELGRGGMGAVHQAWDATLRRWVALKVLLNLGGHEEIARFRREAQSAATLSHPGIIGVYEIGQHGDTPYIAMEFVQGRTLSGEGLSIPQACEIMIAVARAVDHAHHRGIIHRDLKPQNIMVDETGQVRVMDFGLAKPLRGRSNVTVAGTIVGTPSYMPPEQADGRILEVDHRSDIYSLGAVLYELLTRRPPFAGKTVLETLTLVVERDAVVPSKINPDVPRDLETIVLRALDKDKTRRYPSAEAFARDLERFLKGQAIEAKRLSIAAQVSRTLRRQRLAWLGGTTAVVAIAAGAWFLGRSSPPDVAPFLAAADAKLAAGDLDGALTDVRTAETLVPGSSGKRLRSTLDRKAQRDEETARSRKAAEDKAGSRERARDAAQPELDAGRELVEKARLDLYKGGADLSKMRATLEEAARHFTKALEIFPGYPEARLGRAQARALQKRPEEAVRDLGLAIETLPGYPAALLARGQILLDRYMAYILPAGWRRDDAPESVRRWIEQAIEDLRKARESGLKGGELEYCDASLALAEEKSQQAVSILTRTIDGGARKEEYYKLRGDALSVLGLKASGAEAQLDLANRALRDYTEAIRMRVNYHDAYRYRAALYFQVGHKDECLADLQWGLRMDPADSVALSDLGTYFQRTARPDDALAYYGRALEIDPDNLRALSNRATIKTERKDYAGARADLERALKVNPDSIPATVNLAAVRDYEGQTEEAVALLSKVLARQTMFSRGYFMRGVYRYKLQRWAEALDDLEKASGIDPATYAASTRTLQEELRKRLGR